MTNKILAVDGDIIAYRTAAVCETHFEGACDAIIDSTLRDIATDTNIPNMRIYISDSTNFRYAIGKTKPYKGNRATMVRPQFLDYCKEYLVKNYGGIIAINHEADDAIASDMVQTGAIHCGIDKDMLQIAGKHYNYVKKEWTEVTPDDAILTLYRQVLMGDASDNVPGLPRIGEKKAADAIQDPETALDDAMAFYEQVCGEKMPNVNHLVYMSEQMSLIMMKTDMCIYEIDFDKSFLIKQNTDGFEKQEGEVVDSQPVIRNLKL